VDKYEGHTFVDRSQVPPDVKTSNVAIWLVQGLCENSRVNSGTKLSTKENLIYISFARFNRTW